MNALPSNHPGRTVRHRPRCRPATCSPHQRRTCGWTVDCGGTGLRPVAEQTPTLLFERAFPRRPPRDASRLDARSRRVVVTEQMTELDAGVGAAQASLQWRMAMGINFFQLDHRKVLGLQLGPDGRPTGALAHGSRFNRGQLKAPLIAVTEAAGWTWQPVVLDWYVLLPGRVGAAGAHGGIPR